MPSGQHDTIAYRLSQILLKLNQGEHLNPSELAEEFGTHIRTIQRDFNVRLASLPLLKTRGRYHLESAYLGRLSFKDIEHFAILAGIRGLLPSFAPDFLQQFLSGESESPWLIRGHHYEDLTGAREIFDSLEEAIRRKRLLALEMLKEWGVKAYQSVQPYRMINSKGIWYLAAVHEGKLKTFGIGGIKSVDIQEATFTRDPKVELTLKEQQSVWDSSASCKVLLSVSVAAAKYFKRRQIIPYQKITKELPDGGLLVETTVGHINQILPIVRYWIPSIRIESPVDYQVELEKSLIRYLESVSCD